MRRLIHGAKEAPWETEAHAKGAAVAAAVEEAVGKDAPPLSVVRPAGNHARRQGRSRTLRRQEVYMLLCRRWCGGWRVHRRGWLS
jgi:hypothetical protein